MRSLKAPLKDYLRRRALRRAGIELDLTLATVALGARSGTWTFDPTGLGPASVIFAVGVGDNIAWELAVIERYGCCVEAFDPTPRCVRWIEQQDLPAGFRFHATGVAAFDGVQRFAAPAKEKSVNFRPDAAGAVELPVARLSTLAAAGGHARIDLLKLDIEGGEYAVLDDLLAAGPSVTQLLVEFHHDRPGRRLEETLDAIAKLRAAGYRLFHVSERGLELSFVLSPERARSA